MSQCYICLENLDESNKAVEHIILNSIGGKLKSSELICIKCNSEMGNEIDMCLANDLNFLASLLNIRRERGTPPAMHGKDSSGKAWKLLPSGKPELTKPEIVIIEGNNGRKQYNIKCRSKKEARKILNGIKKNNPSINVEEIIEQSETKKRYLDDMLYFNVEFGGHMSFRAICKTAVDYYIYTGGNRDHIIHLIPYITAGNGRDIVHYYDNDEVIMKNANEILHAIVLIGDPKEKLLYTYIEFFSVYRLIIILNDNYSSKPIEIAYMYDVIKCIEIEREYSIQISRAELLRMLSSKSLPYEKIKSRLERTLEVAIERQKEQHIGDLIQKALENSLMKYPEGVLITKEMADELYSEVMKQMNP